MKLWPKLYKKTSTGAIQEWTIGVRGHPDWFPAVVIYTWHGQVDGKIQEDTDRIEKGKNVGKANETSPEQQGIAEAQAKWEKKKKSGYVENLTSAKNDELDDLIEGGVLPMLAHTFEKQGHKIKYPCHVQPKLDGLRMIAILKDGKCTLWSRTRKPITSCPHIVSEIEKHFKEDIVLDGEAYSHKFKDNFEHIVHLVRQETPDAQCTDVEYHVYDTISDDTFAKRNFNLNEAFNSKGKSWSKYLVLVDTGLVDEESEVSEWFQTYTKQGYEGAMLRNSNGLYVNKRSSDLIKVKEMQDAEFEIIGVEEGRGKLSGHVGAFVCKTKDGQEFKAKPAGATERLREYFLDSSLWEGRELVVQYQALTSYGIPRFPVGLRLKEQI